MMKAAGLPDSRAVSCAKRLNHSLYPLCLGFALPGSVLRLALPRSAVGFALPLVPLALAWSAVGFAEVTEAASACFLSPEPLPTLDFCCAIESFSPFGWATR